jgi:hypothetical protein
MLGEVRYVSELVLRRRGHSNRNASPTSATYLGIFRCLIHIKVVAERRLMLQEKLGESFEQPKSTLSKGMKDQLHAIDARTLEAREAHNVVAKATPVICAAILCSVSDFNEVNKLTGCPCMWRMPLCHLADHFDVDSGS